jgi:GAF domain-containing protein
VPEHEAEAGSELERLRVENETLSAVVGVVASGPDLVHILDRVVDLLAKATESHASFVYLPSGERLVLRAASPVYSHLVGKISFPVGAGLAGWAMRERRPAFIREGAIDDPRSVYVPELEEERFQSMVAVPIASRSGASIGAIILHTVAPREFDERIINVLSRAASLVSGAIENARLYEEARERVEELTRLSTLGREIAAVSDRASLYEVAARGMPAMIGADLCRIYELEPDGTAHRVAALPATARPPRETLEPSEAEAVAIAALRTGSATAAELSTALDLPDLASATAIPLGAGGGESGLIVVAAKSSWSNSERELMRAAAHQIGLALERVGLIERLTGENAARDLFDALLAGETGTAAGRAADAGIALERPHLVAVARSLTPPSESEWRRASEALELALTRHSRGGAYHRGSSTARALLPVGGDGVEPAQKLAAALRELAAEHGLAIGLGEARSKAEGARRSLREADDAARIGEAILDKGDVVLYRETGAYRYLIGLLDSGGPDDHLSELAEQLASYDRERSSRLLLTLDVYLEQGRSIAAASRELWIHANTLRQRLERIESLTGVELAGEDLLALHLAVKLALARS